MVIGLQKRKKEVPPQGNEKKVVAEKKKSRRKVQVLEISKDSWRNERECTKKGIQ